MPLDRNARTALRFLLGHLLVGVLAAFLFAGLLIATDAFSLKTLIFEQERGWLASCCCSASPSPSARSPWGSAFTGFPERAMTATSRRPFPARPPSAFVL